jgi:exonuclease III
MKFITLNTWMGGLKEPLLNFVRSHADEIDIFCFQEVLNGSEETIRHWWPVNPPSMTHDLYDLLKGCLPDHEAVFHPNIGTWTGLATFVKKSIPITAAGDRFVFKTKAAFPGDPDFGRPHAKNLQYVTFGSESGPRTTLNFHGLWNGGEKTDVPERITQSKNIVEFLKSISGEFVLGGDFNLLPETESMKIIEEESNVRNLIREFGISSTRTKFYNRTPEQYADYVFVSRGIKVKDFKVLPDEVSDHSPLYLEFE